LANTYLQKLSLFSRDTRLYLVSTALIGLCWMGIYGVLFNLYLLRLGYDPEFIGLVNAVRMLAYAIFALPAGALGGRWGVRRMMIVGLSLLVIGLGLPLLTEFLPAALQDAWLLLICPIGFLGATLNLVNAGVYLMGATGESERSHVFSIQFAIWPAASFVGSLVGGLLPEFFASLLRVSLDDPAPYRYSLSIAVVLLIPGIAALLAMREAEMADTEQSVSKAGPAPYALIVLMALVHLLQGAGEGAIRTFFNVYLDTGLGVATHRIGTLAAVGQLLAMPAALAAPMVIARWKNGPTFVGASLCTALSLLPLALVRHWGAAGLGFAGVMAMGSLLRPAILVYRMGIVSPGWRALMNGACNMAMGLSSSAMALGGGYIVKTLGYRGVFLTGAAVTTAGAILFWICFRIPRGEFASRLATDSADV